MISSYLLILAVLILLTALLFSSVGQAGASGYLAVMALMGVAPAVMKPTALVLNLLVACIATVRFGREGRLSWGLFWPFAAGSVPLAAVGGAIQLPARWYGTLVGVVLLIAAVRLLLESRRPSSADAISRRGVPLPAAIVAGAAIGLVAGLTGIGGGIFLTPFLLFTGWTDTRETGGVSAAFIAVNSAAGLAGNIASVQALPPAIPLFAVAAAIGGLVGSELGARRVATQTFRQILAVVLVIAGVQLMFR